MIDHDGKYPGCQYMTYSEFRERYGFPCTYQVKEFIDKTPYARRWGFDQKRRVIVEVNGPNAIWDDVRKFLRGN